MAWRTHLARKFIPKDGIEVEITGFVHTKPGIAELQYRNPGDNRRMVDTFNVRTPQDMHLLSHAHSDEKVMAILRPDDSADDDGHPEVAQVWHDGYKPGTEQERA